MSADLGAYALLFAAAFGSATLLPGSSEALLAGMLLAGRYDAVSLWLIATLGNTAGSVLNWWLGGTLRRWQQRRWFPATPQQLDHATGWFQRYGTWSLLLAWTPLIGDALTVIAGLLRVRLDVFVLLVAIGKGARYAVLIWLTEQIGV